MPSKSSDRKRCGWVGDDPLYLEYHDREWGVPLHDDRQLFEMLILEGAQAGLSWITVLKKRENYRRAFDKFDARKIARYDARKKREVLLVQAVADKRITPELALVSAAKMGLSLDSE